MNLWTLCAAGWFHRPEESFSGPWCQEEGIRCRAQSLGPPFSGWPWGFRGIWELLQTKKKRVEEFLCWSSKYTLCVYRCAYACLHVYYVLNVGQRLTLSLIAVSFCAIAALSLVCLALAVLDRLGSLREVSCGCSIPLTGASHPPSRTYWLMKERRGCVSTGTYLVNLSTKWIETLTTLFNFYLCNKHIYWRSSCLFFFFCREKTHLACQTKTHLVFYGSFLFFIPFIRVMWYHLNKQRLKMEKPRLVFIWDKYKIWFLSLIVVWAVA